MVRGGGKGYGDQGGSPTRKATRPSLSPSPQVVMKKERLPARGSPPSIIHADNKPTPHTAANYMLQLSRALRRAGPKGGGEGPRQGSWEGESQG